MAMQEIAESNRAQQEVSEAPKGKTLEKAEESNKIDYNLDKVDEKKLQEYIDMTDYIRENGWKYKEYNDEFNQIMEEKIKPFEKQIKDILEKSDGKRSKKEKVDRDSMSDEEIAKNADERLEHQPEELKKQQEIIARINDNWSPEEINKLNEIVAESMAEVQTFAKKIWYSKKKNEIEDGEEN